jgi:hypothetical protein
MGAQSCVALRGDDCLRASCANGCWNDVYDRDAVKNAKKYPEPKRELVTNQIHKSTMLKL